MDLLSVAGFVKAKFLQSRHSSSSTSQLTTSLLPIPPYSQDWTPHLYTSGQTKHRGPNLCLFSFEYHEGPHVDQCLWQNMWDEVDWLRLEAVEMS